MLILNCHLGARGIAAFETRSLAVGAKALVSHGNIGGQLSSALAGDFCVSLMEGISAQSSASIEDVVGAAFGHTHARYSEIDPGLAIEFAFVARFDDMIVLARCGALGVLGFKENAWGELMSPEIIGSTGPTSLWFLSSNALTEKELRFEVRKLPLGEYSMFSLTLGPKMHDFIRGRLSHGRNAVLADVIVEMLRDAQFSEQGQYINGIYWGMPSDSVGAQNLRGNGP